MFKLPEKDFRWLSPQEISGIDWKIIDTNGVIGYFVECDLTYPQNIRSYTNEFPLCPESKLITYEMLSPYQKEFLKKTYKKSTYQQRKLTSTFLNRDKM